MDANQLVTNEIALQLGLKDLEIAQLKTRLAVLQEQLDELEENAQRPLASAPLQHATALRPVPGPVEVADAAGQMQPEQT